MVGNRVSVTPINVHHDEAVPTKASAVGPNDAIASEVGLACVFVKKPLVAAVNVGNVKVIGARRMQFVVNGEKDLASES